MKNDSTRGGVKISIPPTLLFSLIAKIDDVRKAVTMDAKCAGDLLYVVGETRAELGASEYYRYLARKVGQASCLPAGGTPAPPVGQASCLPIRVLQAGRLHHAGPRTCWWRGGASA
jgi:hypothetical protein